MRLFCLLMMAALTLSACRTLDYAKGRGEVIRDREARQAGERVGDF